MLIVKFQGMEWLFTGESLDESGALATVEAYQNGETSYAHWFPERGTVERFGAVIGSRAELEVVGACSTPDQSARAWSNILDSSVWRRP